MPLLSFQDSVTVFKYVFFPPSFRNCWYLQFWLEYMLFYVNSMNVCSMIFLGSLLFFMWNHFIEKHFLMSDINQMYFLVLVTILILTHCTSLSFSQLSMTMSVVSSPSTVSVLSYVSSVTYNKYKKTGLRICFWAKRCDRHANALTCRFLFCLAF